MKIGGFVPIDDRKSHSVWLDGFINLVSLIGQVRTHIYLVGLNNYQARSVQSIEGQSTV